MRFNPDRAAKKASLDNLSNREGTHNVATYRSASLALFKLIYYYLISPQGSPMADMTLEKFERVSEYVENWTAQHSVDNLGHLFKSKFVEPMLAILSAEEKILFERALAHLSLGKKPFEEKTNEAVWRVNETSFNDRHLQVPLQLVLILVAVAILDFKHAPVPSGQTEKEAIENRLRMILNAFKEQLDDSVCAAGIRHNLLFLVQNVFTGGLGIVIDEDNILVDELRLRIFGAIEKQLDARLAKKFLADDLSSEDFIRMAQALNLEEKLKERLKALGIYDKQQAISLYIRSIDSMEPSKTQQPMLYALRLLKGKIKALPASLAEKCEVFLAKLIETFDAEADKAKLIALANMIERLVLISAQARFLKWRNSELQASWDALQNFIQLPDLESMLEQYSTHSVAIDRLFDAIRRWQSENRVERVQSFFRDWNEENLAKTEADNLVALLFDPAFYSLVKLSEENIADLASASGGFNGYEINRIFLHGLMTPRQEWGENFSQLLSRVFVIPKDPALKAVQEQLKWMQNSAKWKADEAAKMVDEQSWRRVDEPIPGFGMNGYDNRLMLSAPFLASCLQESPSCFSKVLIAAKERVILASPPACETVIQMISEHPRWSRDQKYELVQMQQPGWDAVLYEALAWGNAKGVEVYFAALLASSLFAQLSQDRKRALLLVSNERKEAAWWRALQDNKAEALTQYLTVILSAGVCQNLGVFALQSFIIRPAAELKQLVSISQQHGVSALQVYFELILASDFFRQLPLEVQSAFSQSHQDCFPPAVALPSAPSVQVMDRAYLESSGFTELSFEAKVASLSDLIKEDSRLDKIWQEADLLKACQIAIVGLRPNSDEELNQQKCLFMSLHRWNAEEILDLVDEFQFGTVDFSPELQSCFLTFLQFFAADQTIACALLRVWANSSAAVIRQLVYSPGLFQASSSHESGDSSMSRGRKRPRLGDEGAQDEGSNPSFKAPRLG